MITKSLPRSLFAALSLTLSASALIVAGDYVTVHMSFTGHFTGSFGQTPGRGQPIAFIATDLLQLDNGRITKNWHIEDNLTLLQQMGIANVFPPQCSKK
jgi:predicted ester cyclase